MIQAAEDIYESNPTRHPGSAGYSLGAATPLPIGPCTVQFDLASGVVLPAGMTDAQGRWSLGIPIAMQTSWIGVVFTAQNVVLRSGGPLLGIGELSNGIESRIGL